MHPQLLSLALLCLGAQTSAAPLEGSGESAAPGRWSIAGGCASRTASAISNPHHEAPEPAWSYRVRGTIESEPLVWDELVLLGVRDASTRRSLHLLDLASGRVRCARTLPATSPLRPCLWRDRVAVQPEPKRIDLYAIEGSRLQVVRSFRAEEALSAPLILEGELYLREDGELVRYDLDRNEAVWRVRAPGVFRGSPSVRGELVYAVWYGEAGDAHLGVLRRSDGARLEDVEVGHHGGRIPAADAELRVIVHAAQAFVRFPLPVPGSRGGSYDCARVGLASSGRFEKQVASLYHLGSDPLDLGRKWLALDEGMGVSRWVVTAHDSTNDMVHVLADPESHAELLVQPVEPSRAGALLFLNELAVDVQDFRILWRSPVVPRLRTVPVRDTLLVVRGTSELVALRAPTGHEHPARRATLDLLRQLEKQQAEGLTALASKALRAGERDMARRLIEEARNKGAQGRALESVRTALRLAVEAGPAPPPNQRRVRALVDEEQALRQRPVAELVRRAGESSDAPLRRELLRCVLEREPEHEEAIGLLRAMLPADAPITRPLPAMSWLDYLAAAERNPVRILLPSDPQEQGAPSPDVEVLDRETRLWRSDLNGYRSERLLLITPPGRPGAVARALEIGERICDVLEEIFTPLGSDRSGGEPLLLFLYETRDAYILQSKRKGSLPEAALGWTAGHYSPVENVSRMYVPEDDEESRRLLGTYAHELAHHWLATRSPFAERARITRADLAGFWIVEGFASLIEELRIDPRDGSWHAGDPRSSSLDVLANAAPAQLVPWEKLVGLSAQGLAGLGPEPDRPIPLTWKLGALAPRSEIQLFYAQSGAICHYLFTAEDGRRRAALLAYLRAWYRGEERELDVAAAFGLDPQTLGARVLDYAERAIAARPESTGR